MSNRVLTKTMKAALKFSHKHDRKLTRHPGGFWMGKQFSRYGESYGTPTVEALVRRGFMHYTAWQEGRSGGFPIEAELDIKVLPPGPKP